MAVRSGRANAPGYFAPVSGATYVQLTTFRRDGRAVATPVHLVVDGDVAFFRTWDVAGKAKRLRHTPAVRIAPATFRGRPLGSAIPAQAQLLDGEQPRSAPPGCSPPGTRSCTDGSFPGITATAAGPPSSTGWTRPRISDRHARDVTWRRFFVTERFRLTPWGSGSS
jgi:hypothetical protein